VDEIIRSPQNTRIKNIAKLRDRRGRMTQKKTIIDGIREITRAIETGFPVEEIFVAEDVLTHERLQALQKSLTNQQNIRLTHVTKEVLSRMAFGDRLEGAIAVCALPESDMNSIQIPHDALIVVLEQVEKPGNIGAVLRTMDAVGADLLILADPRTDLFNPNTIRASLGTIFSVPCLELTSKESIDLLTDRNIAIHAARVDGSVPYTQNNYQSAVAFALGSEADGLSDQWQGPQITNIHLPMQGIADSLNVSITGAVLMYETLRQRLR